MTSKLQTVNRKRALTLQGQDIPAKQHLSPVPVCSEVRKTEPLACPPTSQEDFICGLCDDILDWRVRGCSEGYIIKRVDHLEAEMPGELHEVFRSIRNRCDLSPRRPPPTIPLPIPTFLTHFKPTPLQLPSITLSTPRHGRTESSDTIIDIFSPRPPATPAVPTLSSTSWSRSVQNCHSPTSPAFDPNIGRFPVTEYLEGFYNAEVELVDEDTLSRFPAPPDRSLGALNSAVGAPGMMGEGDGVCRWAADDDEDAEDDDSSEDARTITAATPNSASTGSGWSAIWSEPSFEGSDESSGYGVLAKDNRPSAAALIRDTYLQQRLRNVSGYTSD